MGLGEVGRTFSIDGSGIEAQIVYHASICLWVIVAALGLAHWFLKMGRFKEPSPKPENEFQEPLLASYDPVGAPPPPVREPKKKRSHSKQVCLRHRSEEAFNQMIVSAFRWRCRDGRR